jgi:caffeoyl-CoA O-methyltransferase
MTEVTEPLYDYVQEVSLREPELLKRLRQETADLGWAARMQISPEQGQFMALMAELIQAERYLEVGTFTGYSTLAVTLAMSQNGRAVACDISKEWTDVAQRYWQSAGVSDRIDLRLAPAEETLQALIRDGQANQFDLMFIDADKVNYDTYYEAGLQLVRPGGLIMIDNVLWGGSVIDASDQDEDTVAIRKLNAKLHNDQRVSVSLMTIGDGLTLARKR